MPQARVSQAVIGQAWDLLLPLTFREHLAPTLHRGPLLDTPQLAGGRKAEIRLRRIGLLFVRAIRAMSGIDSVTSHTVCAATSMCDGTSLFL